MYENTKKLARDIANINKEKSQLNRVEIII